MIGERLGSFRIVAELGSGAMGTVYRAVRVDTRRPVALKILRPEKESSPLAVRRFEREAAALQELKHPNIVRLLAHGRHGGRPYLVMELIDGPTLERVLAESGPLPWPRVARIGEQACGALHYLHEKGFIHRDMKPSNLMLDSGGAVRLTDLGLAKRASEWLEFPEDEIDGKAAPRPIPEIASDGATATIDHVNGPRAAPAPAGTATGTSVGTPAYMPPEAITGDVVGYHKSDLYSLGCTLFQLLTGRLPFEGSTLLLTLRGHLQLAPPRVADYVKVVPAELDELVALLMAKEPQDRPWDAAAVGMRLGELWLKSERGDPIPMGRRKQAAPESTWHPAVGAKRSGRPKPAKPSVWNEPAAWLRRVLGGRRRSGS